MGPKREPESKKPPTSSSSAANSPARDQSSVRGRARARGRRPDSRNPGYSGDSRSRSSNSRPPIASSDAGISLQERLLQAPPQRAPRVLTSIPSGSGGGMIGRPNFNPMDPTYLQRHCEPARPFGISSVDLPLDRMLREETFQRANREEGAAVGGGDPIRNALMNPPTNFGIYTSASAANPNFYFPPPPHNLMDDNCNNVSRNPLQYGDLTSNSFAGSSFGGVEFSEELRSQYESMMSQQSRLRHPPVPSPLPNIVEEPSVSTTGGTGTDEPIAAALELIALSSPFSITLDTTDINTKPSIFVVPMRSLNFTSSYIQFSIQVFNLPPDCQLTSAMFDAIVESPSGLHMGCQIRRENPNGRRAPPFLETFFGSFKAAQEVGLYNLRVRLILPLTRLSDYPAQFQSNAGVASDTADILVSRNYFRESQKLSASHIQLQFRAFENIHCGRNTMMASAKAWGIACDKSTNFIYFSERVGNQVSCMDPFGRILFQFHQNRPESVLSRPTGICCDESNRRVLICDKDHHRICFFTMQGDYISSFGRMGHQNGYFNYPWDVDVNRDGSRIIVADSRNKRIQLFDGLGNFLSKFSVYEQNPFDYKRFLDYPRGISFDADGQLIYVTDFNSQNVLQIPISFTTSKKLVSDGKLSRPQGIVVDGVGNFLVADSRNNSICHFVGDGEPLSVIRSIGHEYIHYPVNLTLMKNGVVAVLDGHGKIHMF